MLQISLLENRVLYSIVMILTYHLSATALLYLEGNKEFACPEREVEFYCNANSTTELRWQFLGEEAVFVNFDEKGEIIAEQKFTAVLTNNSAVEGQFKSMTSVLIIVAKTAYNRSEVMCSDSTSTKSKRLLITGFPTVPEHIQVVSNESDCMSTLMTVTWKSSPTDDSVSYTLSMGSVFSQVLTSPPAEVTVPNGVQYNVSITTTNCIGTSMPGYILLNASELPADLLCTYNHTGTTALVVEPSKTPSSDAPINSGSAQSHNTVVIALGCVAGVITVCFFAAVIFVIARFAFSRQRNAEVTNIELVHSHSISSLRSVMSLKLQPEMSQFANTKMIISSDRIRLLDSIGEGEFGIVYKAHLVTSVHEMPQLVAVKTLKYYYNTNDGYKLIQESKKMMNLDHPNVLTLIGVCVDAGPAPYLVMPLLAQGNLLSYLRKNRPELIFYNNTEKDVEMMTKAEKNMLDMCVQISKGMEYLVKRKLVHRDLAARNCMVNLDGIIKVADFGLTEDIYARNYFKQGSSASVKLPIKWMAPESLNEGIFNETTDVWAFGVTCWEVYSGGCVPYPGISPLALQRELAMGKRMEKPLNDACSDEMYEIMLDCWNEDPEDRPTFSELVVSLSRILATMAGYFELSPTAATEQSSQQTGQRSIYLQTNSLEQTERMNQDLIKGTQGITDRKEHGKLLLSSMITTEECHYLAS